MAGLIKRKTQYAAPEPENKRNYDMTYNLAISPFRTAKVDIIIPFHGEHHKVSKLINSIIMSIRSNPYQITLIDDASINSKYTEAFDDFDKDRPNGTLPILKVIRSNQQLGFGGACKLGFMQTKNPWVLFMHSDCVVEEPNFMIEMGRSLLNLKSKNVRMITAKADNIHDGLDERLRDEKFNFKEDVILEESPMPLYCFMCHRQLFQKINGFIKEYPYCGYEEEELHHRMKKFGYKQGICGRAWVKHECGGTMNELLKNSTIAAEVEANRDRCIEDLRHLYNTGRRM